MSTFSPCRTRNAALLLSAAVLLLLTTLAGCHRAYKWQLSDVANIVAPLEFALASTDGGTATARDFRGKIVMMYFGYANCPDVCPTTLAKLAGVIRRLGPQGKDVRVLFVTVDPQRDTIPVLKGYVNAFDPVHFVGLRGDAAATAAIARRYRVGYSDGPRDTDGNYVVNHSSAVFIFGPHGRARLLGTSNDSSTAFVSDLKHLIAQRG